MDFIGEIHQFITGSPPDEAAWAEIENLLAGTCFSGMRYVQQNPLFHGEGDVYTHTRMVCGELVSDPEFRKLNGRQQTALFLAALLHDIGKVKTTRQMNGELVSPHHGSAGSLMAREFLWRDCGLCGDPEKISLRETVCALIRRHTLPMHLMSRENAERLARQIAAAGELAGDFTWEMLCMLSKADVKGRKADDIPELLGQVELARMLTEEAGCLRGPYRFPDSHTKHAYLSGRNVQPDSTLFDDTWGEVILLSGLPGTGKDTWIRETHPWMPEVSLDSIRAGMRVNPTEEQGRVVQAAREQAKIYLREKQPFVWNATNLTGETRKKLTGLFEQYGARVRIVYLETRWETRKERNSQRRDSVPEDAVGRMLSVTEPPMPEEAQTVEWICV